MLGKAYRAMYDVVEWIAVVLLLCMTLIVTVSVFWRYALNSPIAYAEEIARFVMVALTMLGAAMVTREWTHVRVEVLHLLIKNERTLQRLETGVIFATLVICAVLTWWNYQFIAFGIRVNTISSYLGIPMWYVYLFLLFSFALMTIDLIGRLYERVWGNAAQSALESREEGVA